MDGIVLHMHLCVNEFSQSAVRSALPARASTALGGLHKNRPAGLGAGAWQ